MGWGKPRKPSFSIVILLAQIRTDDHPSYGAGYYRLNRDRRCLHIDGRFNRQWFRCRFLRCFCPWYWRMRRPDLTVLGVIKKTQQWMAVVTEPTYLQRDVGCVVAAALFASCCIRHNELCNLHNDTWRRPSHCTIVYTVHLVGRGPGFEPLSDFCNGILTFSLLAENFIEFFTVARVSDWKEGNT